MQTLAALVAVVAVVNWVSYIGGVVLAVANPSIERFGIVAGHTVITAALVAFMFRMLETHGRS
jgi:hypothetical protein